MNSNRFAVRGFLGLALVTALTGLFVPLGDVDAATRVLVTVDTETSSGCDDTGCFPPPMSEGIFGVRNGNSYGISLMMDILERNGMRGTFFVNAFLDAYYPEAEVAAMVAGITARGHDVQLHTHAEFLCFRQCAARDLECRRQCIREDGRMAGTSFDHQLALLRQGAANIERWSGRYPIAFRGGAYATDVNTLKALSALGIHVDSSLSGPGHNLARVLPVNKLGTYEGVLEVPLLAYRENLVLTTRDRHLDLESSTLAEQKFLLREAVRLGIDPVIIMMHSFSFCRRELACPNQRNIDRFTELLAYIRQSDALQVVTLGDFSKQVESPPKSDQTAGPIPEIGYWLTLYRSVVRFNDGWNNRIFVLAHAAALALVTVLLVTAARRMRARAPAKAPGP